MPTRSFDHAWKHARTISGWLTEAQAQVLHDEASRACGIVVEIGSHLGRSTVVLASAAERVVAIDPFPSDWRYGDHGTAASFRHNLLAADVAGVVTLLEEHSTDVLARWDQEIGLLYVDGKHDVVSCLRDLGWTRWLPDGASFLVHDAFSSVGVTLAMLVVGVTSRRSRFLGRTGSLALFERASPSPADRLRLLAQLPWFGRNLVVKVLLRLRLGAVARLMGHIGRADPY
ncbi:class I SAM-dependent methyltransferase [Nocardioides sp.]|uniref:class I SAM-dependent methyltransferase n=1 Tax=Nocardioides sp. TaxID=35761 RepID=UPI002614C364|nr:class I SAM-dependent methyltransferase [Nocardioides sp.]MCW2736539.1 hypothetical protein [Nocardioides sp.]